MIDRVYMKKPIYNGLFRLYWTIKNSYLVEAAGTVLTE
jgi:hypothetical protein